LREFSATVLPSSARESYLFIFPQKFARIHRKLLQFTVDPHEQDRTVGQQ
jgi:hypothetical protein